MSKLLAVLVAIFAAAWFATPALATPGPTDRVYFEVCKAATGAPALTGSFRFVVSTHFDGWTDTQTVDVQVGTCSDPRPIKYGTGFAKVVEQATANPTLHFPELPWWAVAAADYRDEFGVTTQLTPTDDNPLPSFSNLDHGYVLPPVPLTKDPRESRMTVIHVTNDPSMGTIEVCKNAAQAGQVFPAAFQFAISSPEDGWITNIAAPALQSVNAGSCSAPISVPVGFSTVTEQPSNDYLYVTDIKVTPSLFQIGPADLNHGTVTALVPDPIAGETKVDFENSLATLKVCKEVGVSLAGLFDHYSRADAAALGPFSFTATGAAAPFSLNPVAPYTSGQCREVGQFVAGSPVTVTELPVVGTAVSDITLEEPNFTDHETVNEAAGTASFFMRPGVNEITFTNDPAAAVPLKVCKLPGTLTGTYSFTTSGLTGYVERFWALAPKDEDVATALTTFTVMPGQCTWVGYFPYHGTITITEAAGNLTGVVIDPLSSTAVLAPGSPDLGARSATVILGNYTTWSTLDSLLYPAIVDFTNGAPVPGTTAPVAPAAVVAAANPTATVVSTSTPSKVTTVKKALKVSSAKIVSIGKVRYVVVRVNGAAKTARVHITLLNKQHKVVSRVTRYVATNKAVRVGNLRLPPSIFSVKVAL